MTVNELIAALQALVAEDSAHGALPAGFMESDDYGGTEFRECEHPRIGLDEFYWPYKDRPIVTM